MSASSKKKIRREQEAANMTERQRAEQVEAKKLRTLTIVFVTVIALVIVATAGILISRGVAKSGIRERSTVAATIAGSKISTAELSYYYIDSINSFYNNLYNAYGSNAPTYAMLMYGVDLTTSLDKQVYDEETGKTWADSFIEQAIASAQSTYALYNEAKANNFALTEEETAAIDTVVTNMSLTATLRGYSNVNDYLHSMYGYGTDLESYKEYYTMSRTAYLYQVAHQESLTYDDAALRAQEDENGFESYSSYNYNIYTVSVSDYLEGGTKDENGTTTYSDEERDAAEKKAEEVANGLIAGAASWEDVDSAIAELPINAEKETPVKSTAYTDKLYADINDSVAEWLTAEGRKAGDMDVVPYTTESTDTDGNVTTTLRGYYVVCYNGVNENTFTLPAVRHILVAFEGGTTDSNGNKTYSDDEKAAAKTAAEELLAQWKEGDATQDSFAALANEKSDDGDGTTGGLYEDIYPGQMVENFENWCYEEGRKAGDTGIVESPYGYHVMYYVSDGDTTYRDFMITNELISEDMQAWYDALVEATTVVNGNTSLLNKDIVVISNT